MTVRTSAGVSQEKLLELLLARIRQRGDLPGFSKVIRAIVGAMHGDNDREFNMTKTVLSDPALTQRVLRLANSAMYAAFGQEINTVSKAVIVLGTETIGHLALGLKLVDGLSAVSASSSSTRTEMNKAVLAGQIARQVVASSTPHATEEAVVCSILHSLGRLMVSFYLPEYWTRVCALMQNDRVTESAAAKNVLGLELDAIGKLIGQRWGFPPELVESLRDIPPRPASVASSNEFEPLDHADWLAAISTMSTHCAGALIADEPSSETQLGEIAAGYAQMLGLDPAEVLTAVEQVKTLVADESLSTAEKAIAPVAPPALPPGKPSDAMDILKRGVADMRDGGVSTSTAQLMTVALETVYQGLGLSRAVAFLRHHEEGKYIARMSFGDCDEELLARLFFNDGYQPDVFHAALANDKMIFVEDAQAPGFVSKLPRWWRDELGESRSFMILPLMLNLHPVGFIYGDWNLTATISKIVPGEVVLLDELRALVVKAIERRCRMEPAWARMMH